MPEKPKNDNLQFTPRSDEKTDASGLPEDLPISRLYARIAQRAVPEELRVEHHLGDGVTYGEPEPARGACDDRDAHTDDAPWPPVDTVSRTTAWS